ncbi:MAG: hypothetical protein ACYS72_06990 [Planctomycetota bacterium]|jgi:hypothetical protein
MGEIADQVTEQLKPLIGLQLSYFRRAADMANFGFGQIRPVKKGSVAEYALHVQCPWRIESPEGIVTGRHDLWEPSEFIEGENLDDWSYEKGDLLDVLMNELLAGYDSQTRSSINTTKILFVERVQANDYGELSINLTGGYHLVLFPAGSRGEDWRFFIPESKKFHLVVSGGRPEMH